MESSNRSNTVLSIGLHPSAIDFSRIPDLDEATLTTRIEAGDKIMRDAGINFVTCLVPADPDAAEKVVRDHASAGSFGVVMIGAGIRILPEHTLLFERLVNVVNEESPRTRFCFNTDPESTVDAIRRWIPE